MRARTLADSSTLSGGLVMKSSAPASMARTLESASPRAVTMITGTMRVAGSDFIRRHASKPSIRGIMASRRTRSMSPAESACRASSPLPTMTESQLSGLSMALRICAFTGSSSTTRTRKRPSSTGGRPNSARQTLPSPVGLCVGEGPLGLADEIVLVEGLFRRGAPDADRKLPLEALLDGGPKPADDRLRVGDGRIEKEDGEQCRRGTWRRGPIRVCRPG